MSRAPRGASCSSPDPTRPRPRPTSGPASAWGATTTSARPTSGRRRSRRSSRKRPTSLTLKQLDGPKSAGYAKAIGLADPYDLKGSCVKCHATVFRGRRQRGRLVRDLPRRRERLQRPAPGEGVVREGRRRGDEGPAREAGGHRQGLRGVSHHDRQASGRRRAPRRRRLRRRARTCRRSSTGTRVYNFAQVTAAGRTASGRPPRRPGPAPPRQALPLRRKRRAKAGPAAGAAVPRRPRPAPRRPPPALPPRRRSRPRRRRRGIGTSRSGRCPPTTCPRRRRHRPRPRRRRPPAPKPTAARPRRRPRAALDRGGLAAAAGAPAIGPEASPVSAAVVPPPRAPRDARRSVARGPGGRACGARAWPLSRSSCGRGLGPRDSRRPARPAEFKGPDAELLRLQDEVLALALEALRRSKP